MHAFEDDANHFALDFNKSAEAGNRAGGASGSGPHTFRKIFELKELVPGSSAASRTRENHRTLESVAQFTDIPGPGVSGEHAARRMTQLHIGAGVDRAERREKMIGKSQGIGAALAKRRECE